MKDQTKFKNAERLQLSILTPLEKRTLRWLADRMPARVNSDHLTLLGFAGMILTGVSYYLAQYNPLFLVAGIVCLAINWFGDSLDGTVARVRNRQRPRYGFYVDHVVDAFGISFVLAGLGLSGYMSPSVAMGFLIVYFLMNIEIYLATYTLGVFKLSYGVMGPTELRLIVCIGNLVLLTRKHVRIGDSTYLLCDVSGVVAIVVLLGITIVSTIKNTKRLYGEERLP
ncbi:MAG TPA: CDP-alcohol phosphatidyltransferase family protein [Terriglobia bacterium]|nr:CDP-alcohol phosphatidyltransferase family protein [Terriglobia bacterium]